MLDIQVCTQSTRITASLASRVFEYNSDSPGVFTIVDEGFVDGDALMFTQVGRAPFGVKIESEQRADVFSFTGAVSPCEPRTRYASFMVIRGMPIGLLSLLIPQPADFDVVWIASGDLREP